MSIGTDLTSRILSSHHIGLHHSRGIVLCCFALYWLHHTKKPHLIPLSLCGPGGIELNIEIEIIPQSV